MNERYKKTKGHETYCIATYDPVWYDPPQKYFPEGIVKTLFVFPKIEPGWTDKEIHLSINWWVNQKRFNLNYIDMRVPLYKCQKLRFEDPFIDWNRITRKCFEEITAVPLKN